MPSWAARIAATYPPGPLPMTMTSYESGTPEKPSGSLHPENHRHHGADHDDDAAQHLLGQLAADVRAHLGARDRADRDQPGRAPRDVRREEDEQHRRHGVGHAGEHVLQAVEP